MGTASAAFHAFAEASSKRWAVQNWADKIAAGFTNSGGKSGDKPSILGYFATLAGQHGVHWVNLGLLPGWGSATGSEIDINRLGPGDFLAGSERRTPRVTRLWPGLGAEGRVDHGVMTRRGQAGRHCTGRPSSADSSARLPASQLHRTLVFPGG